MASDFIDATASHSPKLLAWVEKRSGEAGEPNLTYLQKFHLCTVKGFQILGLAALHHQLIIVVKDISSVFSEKDRRMADRDLVEMRSFVTSIT